MSAVRMVAYGVLELKPKEHSPRAAQGLRSPLFIETDAAELAKEKAADFERDQLRKLVNDELKRYGLLLQRQVVPKGHGWRTKDNSHVLYGQVVGKGAFPTRQVLHEGDFRECCIKAAKLLDDLDRSQLPDTATGYD